jgi:hypothetical protein
MIKRILNRRGTTQEWEDVNPILGDGEFGVEYLEDGSKKLKIGDDITQWNNLDYFIDSNGLELALSAIEELNEEQDSRLQELENANISIEERIDDDENILENNSNRIVDLENNVSSMLDDVANINSKDGEQDVSLNDLVERVAVLENTPVSDEIIQEIQSKDVEQDNRLTSIEDDNAIIDNLLSATIIKDSNQDNRISAVEDAVEDLSDKVVSVETQQSVYSNQFQNLSNKNTEQDTRLTTLENSSSSQSGNYNQLANQIGTLINDLDNEISARGSADTNIQSQVTANTNNITQEIISRIDNDNNLQNELDAEMQSRINKDNDLQNQNDTQDDRLDLVESKNVEEDNRITNLENTRPLKSIETDAVKSLFDNEADGGYIQATYKPTGEYGDVYAEADGAGTFAGLSYKNGDGTIHNVFHIDKDGANLNGIQIALQPDLTSLQETVEEYTDAETADRIAADSNIQDQLDAQDLRLGANDALNTEQNNRLNDIDMAVEGHDTIITDIEEGLAEEIQNRVDEYTAIQEQLEELKSVVAIRGSVMTYDELPDPLATTPPLKSGDAYIVSIDSNYNNQSSIYVVNTDDGTTLYWKYLSEFTVDMTEYYTMDVVDNKLDQKVDKVSNMGLSHNDLTDAMVNKINLLSGDLDLNVFDDEITYDADQEKDILLTRFMLKKNLSVTNSTMSVKFDGLIFRVRATSASNARTEILTDGDPVTATIRRNTFYNSNVEGQTAQNVTYSTTATNFDSTIYTESNEYSIYEIYVNSHWWEINLWVANSKTTVLMSLERRL